MSNLKIITVPHPTLRLKSHEVDLNNSEISVPDLQQFIRNLEETLEKTTNPKGVGLAAPQVDKPWRIFSTRVEEPLTLINPVMTAHSQSHTFGPDKDDPYLEGCLSIPRLYGPIPRWDWVEVDFEVLDGQELIKKSRRFDDFFARVVQHELDHLNGVLFIDHSLKYDLPVYQESGKNKKAEKVEKSFLELL